MNPFALRSSNTGILLSLSGMMAVLGVLIAMAWITEQRREDRFSVLDPDQRQRLLVGTGTAGVAAENEKLQQRVRSLQPEAEIIHDYDVLRTVNELWNAGAEAIAINGNRVVSRTSIRCVGTVIHVNDQPVAPPITIEAIGDTKTLLGAMNMRGNALEELRQVDEAMASVEPAKLMKLPAYSGPQTRRWAKLPEEAKSKGKDSK
jgi:uncharacterized protein YlxW (UPF0749 family)